MEQKTKIKVAMICHLSNPDIRNHLKLDDGRLFNGIKRLLGDKTNKTTYSDFAPWNKAVIADFKKREDLDFYIVSSHSGMMKKEEGYEEEGIHYIFLSYKLAGLLRRIIGKSKLWPIIDPFRKKVKLVIDKINPDLVVLMGTENPYYSCTVLGITKYPVYVMCQTVYNNPSRKGYGMWNLEAAETEMAIFKEHRYFGVYCKMHYDLVRQYSPKSLIFKFGYPTTSQLLEPTETDKEYDFVNFAMMMDSRKGFPDAIQALAIVKKKYPEVKLNLIGTCTEEKKMDYAKMIEGLGLQDNVVFTPFFEKQSDLFLHIQKSRFAVLPCKVDNISGTMMQAMQLGLPIVVYRTTGTPSFNKENQCALIAVKENVEELAQHMLSLMDDPALAQSLRVNGREWQEKHYGEGLHNGDRIVDNFYAIIDHFRNDNPIPQMQLFNPDKDD